MAKKIKTKNTKSKLAAKLTYLKDKRVLFGLFFAVAVSILLFSTSASEMVNPASKTYNVKLPGPECIHTKSGTCSPISGTEGLVLSGPSSKTVEYVIKGVGPGRYNLDFSYSIPQVLGVSDYGYLNFKISGNIVNIGNATNGNHHFLLYGNTGSTSKAPLTGTGTFTSFGVKYPKSDIHIRLSYTNKISTQLRLTAIQLRPQKSRSGWTCSGPDEPCKASSDYKYYYAANAKVSTTSTPNTSTSPSSSTSQSSSNSSNSSSQSQPAQTVLTPSKNQTNGYSSTATNSNVFKTDSEPSQESNSCNGSNIFTRSACRVHRGIQSFITSIRNLF